MATLNFRRFTHIEALKQVHPKWLKALLAPHAQYFTDRGVSVDGPGLDYESLINLLVEPDAEMPPTLINALYFIHEMSRPEDMDDLLEDNERRSPPDRIAFDFIDQPTPMDVAVQVWLQDPNRLEERHAEQQLTCRRSFECFQALKPAPFKRPGNDTIVALQNSLDDWFADHRRGRDCRVFVYPKDDGIWFLVRHGMPYRREGARKGKKSTAVYYQPEQYDVIVYDEKNGDLRINSELPKEKPLYCTNFGHHLFGDENHFPGTAKYTLEPLRTLGENTLACADVTGLEWVRLKEIWFFRGGKFKETEIRRADDVFAAFEENNRSLPSKAALTSASFQVKFADSKTPRMVTIRPKNIAKYTRDEDSVVLEKWMRLRGFIMPRKKEETADETVESNLDPASVQP